MIADELELGDIEASVKHHVLDRCLTAGAMRAIKEFREGEGVAYLAVMVVRYRANGGLAIAESLRYLS